MSTASRSVSGESLGLPPGSAGVSPALAGGRAGTPALPVPKPSIPTSGSAEVRVKICGIRSVRLALDASEAGADLLGLNFAPVSKRRVDEGIAREAVAALKERDSGTQAAGIFVNQPVDEVARIARQVRLDYVQLSGDETVEYCREVAEAAGVPVISAVRLAKAGEASRVEALRRSGAVRLLLADAAAEGSWGGSGQAWRWEDAAELAAAHPMLLAGGLTPENVSSAVAAVRPWGVDVASGVETDGQTDAVRVRAFIERAKGSKAPRP